MLSTFAFPTRIQHGTGALAELPAHLREMACQRPLVVTDPGLLAAPAFALLRDVLPADATIFSAIHPNPVETDVAAAAEAWRAGGCDGVIGFGGGSALDVAKIVRAAVALGGRWPELTWKDEVGALAPFIAIPTTAGTGSEVGRSSVITFGKTKRVLFHPALLSRLVMLDPRATAGLPPALTAATGMDALTHCIESFTSPVFHPLCDAIALEGARIAFENLPRAVADGADLGARGMMQIAATMGGIAFQKDLGAVHSLSHPLSAHFGLNHGLANALCLVPVMRWNAAHKPGLYGRIGALLDWGMEVRARFPRDGVVIDLVKDLLMRIGITGGLRAHGVTDDALEMLADAAFADSCHATNPVPVTRNDLRGLYAEAL